MNRNLDEIVGEVFADEDVPPDDDTLFKECQTWDSLKHVQLVVAIQNGFDVDLSAEEIAGLTSKRRIRDLLHAKGRL